MEALDNKKNLIFSMLGSTGIILICLSFRGDFFNTDDVFNEMLGFYTQFGKIWSSGHIPFIVDTIFVGGNSMIDLGKGVFSPQAIIMSIFTYYMGINYTGILLAFINMTLVIASSIYIAKYFSINTVYSYTLGLFMAIQPVFLYQYSAGWWNAANGHALAMLSIATFLFLVEKFTIKRILSNFISVIFLLCAGWPHGVLGYSVFVIIILVYRFSIKEKIISLTIIALPSLLALVFAIPIYSEYIISSHLLSRPNDFTNHGDFLSPQWSSILMGFNPSYYDYIHYFGGYRLLTIPIAFSTLLLPVIFFYRKVGEQLRNSSHLRLILVFVGIFFLCTQMPTQFGPLRWPFRFIPFLSLTIALFTFYVLEKAERTQVKYIYYISTLLLLFLISISSFWGVEDRTYIYLSLQIVVFIILCFIPIFVKKISWGIIFTPMLSLVIMLVGTQTLGGKYISHQPVNNEVDKSINANFDGFILSFTGHDPKPTVNDLNSAQFGIYHIRAINGYSPVGNIHLESLLPYPSAHAIFDTHKSLNNILVKAKPLDVCISQIMGISTIDLSKNDFLHFEEKLKSCGYTEMATASYGDIYASLPKSLTINWKETPLSIFPISTQYKIIEHSNNYDILHIGKRQDPATIIFPRVWWDGYTATFNGKPLNVETDSTGVLVKVDVPAGEGGELKLSYFPKTWRKLFILPVSAILILIIFLMFIYERSYEYNSK